MKNEIAMKLLDMILNSENSTPEVESESEPVFKGRYIVLANRGNTVVGDLYDIGGNERLLKNASVIRRWGTSKGLGQLAIDGQQSETVLDFCGEFEFDVTTTCGMIKVTSNI